MGFVIVHRRSPQHLRSYDESKTRITEQYFISSQKTVRHLVLLLVIGAVRHRTRPAATCSDLERPVHVPGLLVNYINVSPLRDVCPGRPLVQSAGPAG